MVEFLISVKGRRAMIHPPSMNLDSFRFYKANFAASIPE